MQKFKDKFKQMSGVVEAFVIKQGVDLARSAASDQAKKLVGEALNRNVRVQQAKKRMDQFAQCLQQRFHRGRKAASEAALQVGGADATSAAAGREAAVVSHAGDNGDIARLEDLDDFKDKWSLVRDEASKIQQQVRQIRKGEMPSQSSDVHGGTAASGLSQAMLLRFERAITRVESVSDRLSVHSNGDEQSEVDHPSIERRSTSRRRRVSVGGRQFPFRMRDCQQRRLS